MRTLYPASEPFARHGVTVGDGHTLAVAEYGRPDGLPAVLLHGGPGGASAPWHACFFDPDCYRVVVFDQRGCGRSSPHAALEANTIGALVADIERLRAYLEIERWLVFGGSWGATLAVAYAERYPASVAGLVLRAVFLGRDRDIRWFYQDGAHRLLPELWREFVAPIPHDERDNMIGAYHRRLFGRDDIARMTAAKAWSLWEGRAATLWPRPGRVRHFADPAVALPLARIGCQYFARSCFLEPDQLLRDAHCLADVPGTIVHGRYDLVCPIDQGDALARAWPRAALHVIPDAGHASTEPGTVDALVRATDRFAREMEP